MPFFADAMQEGYILVEYDGKLTRTELDQGRVTAGKLMVLHDCSKLLIDFQALYNRISLADIYYFTDSLKDLLSGIRIGLVVSQAHERGTEFAERVAANRGLRLKVFSNYWQAKVWLVGNS
jgi:hypothetical protein